LGACLRMEVSPSPLRIAREPSVVRINLVSECTKIM
jgi:hypothetical protein